MATLDHDQVDELLFGDTDPRQVAARLAKHALTLDAQEREQRAVILTALSAHATAHMAARTAALARWTFILACITAASVGVALLALVVNT